MIIEQISTTPVDSLANGSGDATVSVLELLVKGGWMMIPIILLSLIAVYIFVERMLTLKDASQTPPEFMEKIKNLVISGEIQNAQLICSQTITPLSVSF